MGIGLGPRRSGSCLLLLQPGRRLVDSPPRLLRTRHRPLNPEHRFLADTGGLNGCFCRSLLVPTNGSDRRLDLAEFLVCLGQQCLQFIGRLCVRISPERRLVLAHRGLVSVRRLTQASGRNLQRVPRQSSLLRNPMSGDDPQGLRDQLLKGADKGRRAIRVPTRVIEFLGKPKQESVLLVRERPPPDVVHSRIDSMGESVERAPLLA